MNEELDYAEMLEIPVETVTVNRKERKKRTEEPDLQEQLIGEVNERMSADDPAYAESTPIARETAYETRKARVSRRIILGEFVAVCALCAAIFLTNIFMPDSAINTFVRGLFEGSSAQTQDTRLYTDFTLASVVNDTVDTEIAVSSAGVLSFTAKCSVYSPVDGAVASVNGNAEDGYSVEIKHSDSFSTIMSGLDIVYSDVGDAVKNNIPLGFSNGEREVRVMFYSDGSLISDCTVEGTTLSWS